MYFGYGAGCWRDPRLCSGQWWLVCWRRCPQDYRRLYGSSCHVARGERAGPRRVGGPQAQPKPSQLTLHCRGTWRGFSGVSPHGGTAQPFSLWVLGTPGNNRQRCWGTDGTRHRTDGSVPDRQPRGREAGGPRRWAGPWGVALLASGWRHWPGEGQAPPAIGDAGTAGPVGTGLGRGRTWARGRDTRPGGAAPAGGGGTGPRRVTPVRGEG